MGNAGEPEVFTSQYGGGDERAAAVAKVYKGDMLLLHPSDNQPWKERGVLQRWCFQKGPRRAILIVFLSACVAIMLLQHICAWGLLLASSTVASSPVGSPTTHASSQSSGSPRGRICTVKVASNGEDSAPNILSTFKSCGRSAYGVRNIIRFQNATYSIASVMNPTGLKDVDIELRGTLSWDNSDINYWLDNSLPMGYQNQSTAWLLGGEGITFQGYGFGTFNGNGDAWYEFVNGASNYPRRPHQLTITGTTNSIFEGLNFLRSQMWTMTVTHSSNVLLQDIYVNNTSLTGVSSFND